MATDFSRGAVARAWLVHVFTASGAVLAILALAAAVAGEPKRALLFLLIALVVDGVDGTLARRYRVAETLPRIHGETLDLVIDYLTYVFVPTMIIWYGGMLPPALAAPLAAAIQLSSLYVFARADMKTEDGYFRGFPALWNLVAFYLVVAAPGETAGAVIVILLVVLTFAPIHFVHPFRARDFGPWPAVAATVWLVASFAMLWPDWSDPLRRAWLWTSSATAAVVVGFGLLRSIRRFRTR